MIIYLLSTLKYIAITTLKCCLYTKPIALIFLFSLSGLTKFYAQVGIGTTNPDPSAILEVNINALPTNGKKGFLPPRMTTVERNNINGGQPAEGLVIYNSDVNCLQWFNGTFWFDACSKSLMPSGDPSSGGTAVVTSWSSEIGCNIGAGPNNSPASTRQAAVNETMVQNVPAPTGATVTLVANVNTVGTYNVVTNNINGLYFTASGTFAGTGNQIVTLNPVGTPSSAGNHTWTTQLTPSIDVYGSVITAEAPLGSTYTAHFNGVDASGNSTNNTLTTYTTGETFDQNATCAGKPISAQGCGGVTTVTLGAETYNTVDINGQCWLTTNLNQPPSQPDYAAYTETSWTNANTGDQGYWGYFNTTDDTGASGWNATESEADEGLLYQWCAMMEANISERSKGACPDGFHVPSDCEWMFLEHGLGLSLSDQLIDGGFGSGRGTDAINDGRVGEKLKANVAGQAPADNASGFTALFFGNRNAAGAFRNRTSNNLIWTSNSPSPGQAIYRNLSSGSGILRTTVSTGAFNVRCLKD